MQLIRYGLIVTAAAAAMLAQTAVADEAAEKAIKARQAVMSLYSWNLGALGAMAKGNVDYDAKAADTAAGDLLALAKLNTVSMWPEGSDSASMPGKTRALPEAWSTYPEIAQKGQALIDAAAKLAESAGDGLDALKANIGDVGKACGGCHKPFRAEKN